MLSHCYGNVGWCIDHIWQVCNMSWITASPQTTYHTCSAVILVFWLSFKTVPPPDEEVVHIESCRSGYATTLYQECGVMYGPYLIVEEHIKDHSFTSNHTPDMFSYSLLDVIEYCLETRRGSGTRRIIQVWICYYTISGVWGDAWTISDRWGTYQGSWLPSWFYDRAWKQYLHQRMRKWSKEDHTGLAMPIQYIRSNWWVLLLSKLHGLLQQWKEGHAIQ